MVSIPRPTIHRRQLLIGGGAGVGLVVAWGLWPRRYGVNLAVAEGESVFGPYLKIGADGQVTVAVPQSEHGQGVYTALPQIVADELGADWRTVAVEAAPINPLYANPLAAGILFGDALALLPASTRAAHAQRTVLMLTGGSTSIRQFEGALRTAGAAARVLLCKAAARAWDGDWRSCGTADGFVVMGDRRERFGVLAERAAAESLPGGELPLRMGDEKRLTGESLPRTDAPAKVDGSALFAADIRRPGMVFASIRQGPIGDTRLVGVDIPAARAIPGIVAVIENDGWVAAVGSTWWAANRAVDAMAPRFETHGLVDDRSIAAALDDALAGEGARVHDAGDIVAAFAGARTQTATYRVGAALHAAIEPTCATAEWRDGRLTLWMPTQAPALARAVAARALGIGEDRVILHPTIAGGSFGANLDHRAAEQVAVLARRLDRPVQLSWSRGEDCLADRYRAPAAARMTARVGRGGTITGWHARIAAPRTGRDLARRLLGDDIAASLSMALPGSRGDALATEGAVPAYGIPNVAVDHHPAELGLPAGWWRSGAHSYAAFFTECFLDELAGFAGMEAHSFRIAMLGGDVRLARCLSTVATMGGWQGGVPGSAQGIACHRMRGSAIACMAEAHIGTDRRVKVDRLVVAVDCGRVINPELVRQQIEGGLIFGMAAATGASTGFDQNLPRVRGFAGLNLPRLADTPEIMIELIGSDADPGGVSELAVPVVAPAIANALHAATGRRYRSLPLLG
ncbi:xanthine dehydrogenase family protein molybdopterin-binding subunit [Sphingomonas sp. CFBP 13720]|uniref:xanthine dehydrogenase family protein molybdopterin-binding subunit n=1 Tax=Sphingomonas sp. CFBP 13720 TaxID=2775302 RepID=UPI00177D48F9|nr:molybdopterin cofactor-binding domain-containing protein [Sphingomonas sp. CFBP 13720]MBD8680026.1 xanthine dehydrogenase family protein molybdopterin-binding subunit [Sphingomonas sp. CFBP 13720]